MKNCTYFILSLMTALILSSCAKTEAEKVEGQSSKYSTLSIEEIMKEHKIDPFECDGEGSEFSGKYTFTFTNEKGQCDGNTEKMDLLRIHLKSHVLKKGLGLNVRMKKMS